MLLVAGELVTQQARDASRRVAALSAVLAARVMTHHSPINVFLSTCRHVSRSYLEQSTLHISEALMRERGEKSVQSGR